MCWDYEKVKWFLSFKKRDDEEEEEEEEEEEKNLNKNIINQLKVWNSFDFLHFEAHVSAVFTRKIFFMRGSVTLYISNSSANKRFTPLKKLFKTKFLLNTWLQHTIYWIFLKKIFVKTFLSSSIVDC